MLSFVILKLNTQIEDVLSVIKELGTISMECKLLFGNFV